MKIAFVKYHGCGNDFILINNLSNTLPKFSKCIVKNFCDRNLGIGADGLILLNYSETESFEMVYYNNDGKISSMCGNGARCAMHFYSQIKVVGHKSNFLACDGVHHGEINENLIKISLQNIEGYKLIENQFFINTGSPHLVRIVDDIFKIDIIKLSRESQKLKYFKNHGVNVNFVSIIDNGKIQLRTYERGVEDETLSCGTGAVAAALSLSLYSKSEIEKVNVKTLGGDLTVEFKRQNDNFYDIYLTGEVKKVFEGTIDYEKN